MTRFKEIPKSFSYPQMEREILSFWKENRIFERSVKERKGKPRFVFYEGPPTANGKPGIHHVMSRAIKDLVCRYKTMRGYLVERKAGWDTHGLPVEIEVEKELGIDTKPKILEYGVDKFNAKCRESVFKYKKDWDYLTERMGYWLDLEDYYITCDNNYIETVWWLLSQLHQKGLIYQGHKIIPYCPRCGTGLSSHEVSQGYHQAEDPSVFVKMRLEQSPDTSFLVWTTTPWTLISNVALAVSPKAIYVKVEHQGEKLILAKELVDKALEGEYKTLEEFPGQKLEKMRYQPLFNYVKLEAQKVFYVATADFVTLEDGTGIVHIAPAFGADDYALGQKHGLPLPSPVDESGRFTAEVTPWKGMFIKDADPKIIQDLKERKFLYKQGKYVHSYPFCWRCDTPLIYYARKSWYIKTTAVKDRLVANNNQIHWYPPEIGRGRFGEWLENNVDWSLSRERFWGTPLNIWVCQKCGMEKSISSIQELKNGENVPEKLDLHKPYVDQITFPCPCGGKMQRTPEVIDVWFDSGSMPYAQWHYPFENQKNFAEKFPADFICEGVDQTRGWFYSLLAISTMISNQPAYKNVIVIEFVQDKLGQKMSKSRGNVVEPKGILEEQGADALRWYLLSVSHPWTPTKFDHQGVKEVIAKFLGTLVNTYSFFALYANIDKFDPNKKKVPVGKRPLIDRWLSSRTNTLIADCTKSMDAYDLTRTARLISSFVMDELSNWYVRRNRRRFWKEGEDHDKLCAYQTLHEALLTVLKLSAPFIPFATEELFQGLQAGGDKDNKSSVHLAEYPKALQEEIDPALEQKMADLIKIVELARAVRNKNKIKVRQPLAEMLVYFPQKERLEALKDIEYLASDELNVKRIKYLGREEKLVNYSVKPKFGKLGPKFGDRVPQVAERIKKLSEREIMDLKKEGSLKLDLNGGAIELALEDVEILQSAKEGLAVEADGDFQVALDTQITEELEDEGLVRELVNRVQNLRKEAGFQITDRIKLYLDSDDRVKKAVAKEEGYIAKETLALDLLFERGQGSLSADFDLNGHPVYLAVAKVTQVEGK